MPRCVAMAARRSSSATTCVRSLAKTEPRLVQMVLADPAGIVAELACLAGRHRMLSICAAVDHSGQRSPERTVLNVKPPARESGELARGFTERHQVSSTVGPHKCSVFARPGGV